MKTVVGTFSVGFHPSGDGSLNQRGTRDKVMPSGSNIRPALSGLRHLLPRTLDQTTGVATEKDWIVLDTIIFDRAAAVLPRETLTSYLCSLSNTSTALLSKLAKPAISYHLAQGLVEAVHTLAGSAGLLGFSRLSSCARVFVQAFRTGHSGVPRTDELIGALEITLESMRDLATSLTRIHNGIYESQKENLDHSATSGKQAE